MASIIVVRYSCGGSYNEDRYPQENHEWEIGDLGGVKIYRKDGTTTTCIAYYSPYNLIWVCDL